MRKLVVTINDNAVMPRLRLAIRQLNGVERVATLVSVLEQVNG